jgi:hypothetical protein
MRYIYTVWLKDNRASTLDQDSEWPACFVIDGSSEQTAKAWGDHLAARYARTHDHELVRSFIEDHATSHLPGLDTLPVISESHEASDDEIGW